MICGISEISVSLGHFAIWGTKRIWWPKMSGWSQWQQV